MSEFLTSLRCHRTADQPKGTKRYKLDGPLIYRRGPGSVLQNGYILPSEVKNYIIVPAGFITDGASIPSWLWFAIPPTGMTFKAAILHDYLGDLLVNKGTPAPGFETQLAIDELFLDAMVTLKVPGIQRFMMFHALRLVAKRRRLP